jgi:hypothetical protein
MSVPGDSGYGFLYFLAGVTYLASLFYIVLLKLLEQRTEAQAYVQFVGDLLLISALVYWFSGISSPFSILYLIVIAVASSSVPPATSAMRSSIGRSCSRAARRRVSPPPTTCATRRRR